MARLSYALFPLLVAYLFQPSMSIVLCDEGCLNLNAGDLGICMKDDAPDRYPLLLMGLFPCNVPDFRARGLTVAGQMAARAVRNSTLLQDYRLEISFSNTMCERLAGVRAFIRQLSEEASRNITRHMIIGPGCSAGAVTIAETAPFYQLTQISYTATSITLSDQRRFPTFLRTISSDNASIAMIGAVLEEFQWEQLAIITLRNELFTNLTAVMLESFTSQGVRVITENLFFDEGQEGDFAADIIDQLNTTGARIVLLNVLEDSGRELLCYAYRRGMLFPRYLFITYFWWSEGWWLDPSSCTVAEIIAATHRTIAIDYFPEALIEDRDKPTDVGLTSNDFWRDFRGNLSELGYPSNEALRQAGYVYDAVWTAAFALDDVERQLRAGVLEGVSSLRDFSYDGNPGINQQIFNSAKQRSFIGVTGNVSFNEFGDREPKGEIYQYRFEDDSSGDNLTALNFAIVNEVEGGLTFLSGESSSTVFPGGVTRAAEELYIFLSLFVIMTILSLSGFIFAVWCIVFNLVFRKKKVVKLTSPHLNVVTILGAVFFYVDVILFGVDQNIASFDTVDALCQARIWVSSIGFSLFFGPILAKAFRVYYIFRSVQLKKKPLKDWILLLAVAVMVVLDVVFLIIVTIDDWRLRLKVNLLIREGGEIPLIVNTCSSAASSYWLAVLLAYKGLYLLAGLFLAFQTFNVKIKELRDSKVIVISVYATFVISVVLTVIGVFVTDDPNAFYGLLGTLILLLITSVMLLLFIPRMKELLRNPSGDVRLSNGTPNQTAASGLHSGTNGTSTSTEDNAKIKELTEIVASLKAELEKRQKSRGSYVPASAEDITQFKTNMVELLSAEGSLDCKIAGEEGVEMVPHAGKDVDPPHMPEVERETEMGGEQGGGEVDPEVAPEQGTDPDLKQEAELDTAC